MVPRLAVLILLLPSLALAQTTTATGTITISESNDQDGVISIAECNGAVADSLSFSWAVSTNSTIPTGSTFTLLLSDTSGCPSSTTNSAAHTATITTVATNGQASGTLSVQSVPSLVNHTGLSFSCTVPATLIFCVTTTDAAGATASATKTIQLDAAVPPAPVVNAPSPGDGALNVSWTTGTIGSDGGTVGTAASYEVFVAPHGSAFPANPSTTVTSPSTSARVLGLTNGNLYDVVVYALSTGGNISAVSNTVTGTPVPVDDFWTSYKSAGGRDSGGCSSGAAGAIALLLSPLLLLARKRRRS